MKHRARILLDENIGLNVYRRLKDEGYDVQSVLVEDRGARDEDVIRRAKVHGKIIVTMDKDFGHLGILYSPPGIVLLRLRDPRIPSRLSAIKRALRMGEKLYGYITVVTDTHIRRRPLRL